MTTAYNGVRTPRSGSHVAGRVAVDRPTYRRPQRTRVANASHMVPMAVHPTGEPWRLRPHAAHGPAAPRLLRLTGLKLSVSLTYSQPVACGRSFPASVVDEAAAGLIWLR